MHPAIDTSEALTAPSASSKHQVGVRRVAELKWPTASDICSKIAKRLDWQRQWVAAHPAHTIRGFGRLPFPPTPSPLLTSAFLSSYWSRQEEQKSWRKEFSAHPSPWQQTPCHFNLPRPTFFIFFFLPRRTRMSVPFFLYRNAFFLVNDNDWWVWERRPWSLPVVSRIQQDTTCHEKRQAAE